MSTHRPGFENRIGAIVFGLLAVGGLCGLLAGNWVHLYTLTACGSVSWALWCEAKHIDKR